MQTFAVIEADDVVGDVDPGFGVVGIVALPHPFHFEVQEEAFSNRDGTALSPDGGCHSSGDLLRKPRAHEQSLCTWLARLHAAWLHRNRSG